MARIDNLTNFLTDVASAIKEKKGDNTPIQASNFDTEIINLPSGGGDIYHVATIEEMNTIPNPKENDYCLVLFKEMSMINATDSYTRLYFPDKVVLDTPITGYLDMRLNDENWTVDVSLFGTSNEPIRISIYDQSTRIEIQYTTTDNLTYILATPENQNVVLSAPVKVEYEFNKTAAKFIYSLNINFGGIFQYIEGVWAYANVGMDAKASEVYDNKSAYTNNGAVKGSMTKLSNDTNFKNFFDMLYVYDSSGVTSLSHAFEEYRRDTVLMLDRLDTSNVTDMSYMFSGAYVTAVPKFDTSKVTNMDHMFAYNSKITSIPEFDTTNVTNMNSIFQTCLGLTTVPKLNTSNVTNMSGMFRFCRNLVEIPDMDTTNVTDMSYMFQDCGALTKLPNINTSKVVNASTMFEEMSFTTFPDFDFSNAEDVSYMFNRCSKLTELGDFNTGKAKNMSCFFRDCPNLVSVGLVDASSANDLILMFDGDDKLENLGGFKNLGKGFTPTENYDFRLSHYTCPNITHDSLMNVINNLYDLSSDNYTGTFILELGNNKSKLTADEIAIATNKGWVVN